MKNYKNKKMVIFGLGTYENGSGVSAAKFLAKNHLLKTSKRVHFIGIGGIGISAIARMILLQNKKLTGSDQNNSLVVKSLKKLARQRRVKSKIFIGHEASNLKINTDLVIHTTAISESNPELKKARKLKIPTLTYPQALGLISKDKFTIAVSGTHGKTTTTAMVGEILKSAKLNPTVIVGSLLKGANFIAGKSRYLVCEACEYKKAFLNLRPNIIVITNIDNDHLDYYKNLKNIKKAFAEFASKIKKGGIIIDKNYYSKIKLPKNFKLKIPGEHNIQNAKTALAVAKALKIPKKIALEALKKFKGTWRRFEYKGKSKSGALIYDDYAHHPTEIKATLKAAREFFRNKKNIVIFQPHLYSRTKFLLNDFAESFSDADTIIITDIYAAREKKDKKVNAKMLADKIHNALYISKFKNIEKYLKENTGKNDIIFTMGAGDVFKIGENLVK